MAKRKPRSTWTAEQDRELTELWASGMPCSEIAERIRRPQPVTYYRVRTLKLPLRDVPRAEMLRRASEMRLRREEQLREDRTAVAPLDQASAIWLAGVLDARGYIGVPPTGGSLMLSVVSDDRALIAAAHAAAGLIGSANPGQPRRRTDSRRWIWAAWGTLCIQSLLRALLPHLRVRRRLAELLLAWPPTATDDESQAARAKIRAEIEYLRATDDLPAAR